ncbi:hypothetical protein BpHYR1_039775 [Brachionus plicatilis]|uniref:Uncharacterized protein n=1 Tax=Brachionus plicatilis TaxID=10195 RepID=A0A3M7SKY9_BRAPC|nr:hypothetical protein BpHYR1_039775 [Brachionus plicatilis]
MSKSSRTIGCDAFTWFKFWLISYSMSRLVCSACRRLRSNSTAIFLFGKANPVVACTIRVSQVFFAHRIQSVHAKRSLHSIV